MKRVPQLGSAVTQKRDREVGALGPAAHINLRFDPPRAAEPSNPISASGDGKGFWAKLVRRGYTYAEACEGDWPTRENESPVFEPCSETSQRKKDPPSAYLGMETSCSERRCEIGSASYRENAPHGYDTTLEFERGRDGELYVDSVTVTHWLDYDR